MKWFAEILSGVLRRPLRLVVALFVVLFATVTARAQCPGCVTFQDGVKWDNVSFGSLDEASGLAVSLRNPGVVWSHNDDGTEPGKDWYLFAFRTNGTGLARFVMNTNIALLDVEDMAIGPGPAAGTPYLYVGDIGGGASVRNEVRIIRIPEPTVSPVVVGSPPVTDIVGAQVFTLRYPTFFFWDAEGMLVDPLNGDLYIFTKFNSISYVYRANLNASPTNVVDMELVLTVPFHEVSGAAISQDGSQIALRNELTAQIWMRCPGETISNALTRAGQTIPVMGFAAEPNGEAIAFLPNGRGYLTTTDSPPSGNKEERPPIHFFAATCAPTVITAQPQSTTNVVGANAMFIAGATGENLQYLWRFNGGDLAGENTNFLWLTSLQTNQAGLYSLRVLGDGGAATSAAARLGVRVVKPGISLQPARLTYAPTGGTARLTVVATGSPPFHYNWTFGVRPLHQNTNVLTLLNVSNRSSGSYRVTVTNFAGKAISAFGALRVQIPAQVVIPPVSRTNKVNSLTTFRVGVKGTAPLRYQWYFNNVAISNATRSTLTLARLQATNSGLYHVRVTNFVGINFSAPAQLTVP